MALNEGEVMKTCPEKTELINQNIIVVFWPDEIWNIDESIKECSKTSSLNIF